MKKLEYEEYEDLKEQIKDYSEKVKDWGNDDTATAEGQVLIARLLLAILNDLDELTPL